MFTTTEPLDVGPKIVVPRLVSSWLPLNQKGVYQIEPVTRPGAQGAPATGAEAKETPARSQQLPPVPAAQR